MYKKLILSLFLTTGVHLKGAVKLATAVQPVTQKLSMNIKLLMGAEIARTVLGFISDNGPAAQKIFKLDNMTQEKLIRILKYLKLAGAGISFAPLTYTTPSKAVALYRTTTGASFLTSAYIDHYRIQKCQHLRLLLPPSKERYRECRYLNNKIDTGHETTWILSLLRNISLLYLLKNQL